MEAIIFIGLFFFIIYIIKNFNKSKKRSNYYRYNKNKNWYNKNYQQRQYSQQVLQKPIKISEELKTKEIYLSDIEDYKNRIVEEEYKKYTETIEKIKNLDDIKAKKTILNNDERQVYWALIKALPKEDYIVFTQIALPSILNGLGTLNGKAYNFDFLIVKKKNSFGEPVCAIEFQGSGHYGGFREEDDYLKVKNKKITPNEFLLGYQVTCKTRLKDEVKKYLFNKANILFIEILENEVYIRDKNNRLVIDENKLNIKIKEIVDKIKSIKGQYSPAYHSEPVIVGEGSAPLGERFLQDLLISRPNREKSEK